MGLLPDGTYAVQNGPYVVGQAASSVSIVTFAASNGSNNTATYLHNEPGSRNMLKNTFNVTLKNVGSGGNIQVGPDGFLVAGPKPYIFRLTHQTDGTYSITDPASGHVVTLTPTLGARLRVAPAVPGNRFQVFYFFPRQ